MEYFLLVFIFFALIFDRLHIFFYLIISSLLHEAGHIIACRFMGSIPKVKFSVFGIKLSQYPTEKIKKMLVIICGPMVNLILAAVLGVLLKDGFSLNMYIFMCVNIFLFVFNMLPVSFMDGGQLLQIFVTDSKILCITEILAVSAVFVVTVLITENNLYTVAAFVMFAAYCVINKKHLYY